ncbi:MAG: NAD(P)H-dependent oxidoreductase [Gemmatimonadota bacterium]|nr:MAG: NAD(P)H-dependent oxidoreductase [Gemmatimonadota bacterium]
MMRVLAVYAHSSSKSFTRAILDEFTKGLADAGHTFEINDLYANKFNPVYSADDFAFFMDESVPMEILEKMNLRTKVLDAASAGPLGPLKAVLAKRWLRGKDLRQIAQGIAQHKPKDVLAEQEKVSRSDAIAVVAPNYWMHFPAILKGWITRVFTYGFAYTLKPEGWKGDVSGRVPLLRLRKALIMQPTFFKKEDYESTGLAEAMRKTIDMWGFEYPGVSDVQHVYFHGIYAVGPETLKQYLQKAYLLGKEF